jgi:NAD(P)-dependent dehydrogenase (short-subunit alcohol dehydrogenase family)
MAGTSPAMTEVGFLASDRAAWVTGERITVSGGQR